MKAVSGGISGRDWEMRRYSVSTVQSPVPVTALHNDIYGHYELMPNAWSLLEFHESGTEFLKYQRFLVGVGKLREWKER
jgi:hypothetical protein